MRTSIFLSYARGDDDNFVRQLYDDLVKFGFDVWFDRVSMPSRMLTFHQEIKDAIRSRDRLILVGGKKAAESLYVIEEWKFAIECDKHVIPILRTGDFSVLQPELATLHCEDFTRNDEYVQQLEKLIKNLKEQIPVLAHLYGVPQLPVSYIKRWNLIKEVKGSILSDLKEPKVISGRQALIGVHGMGGIGKSVLATIIAHDIEIRRSFPDGVFWLDIEKNSDIDYQKQNLINKLPKKLSNSIENISWDQLLIIFRTKAILLILDDVWDKKVLNEFSKFGPRCRVLITTREGGFLRTLAGYEIPVSILEDTDALQMLAQAMKMDRSILPSEAIDIIKECGHLPLAIALCGNMIRIRGGDIKSVLERLRSAALEKIVDRNAINEQHTSIWKVIEVSIEELSQEERNRFCELTVFPKNKPFTESVVSLFWKHIEGLDKYDSEELLFSFCDRSILKRESRIDTTSEKYFSFHDLLRDYAVRITGDRKKLHASFADAIWMLREQRSEKYNGQIKSQLPWHLAEAGDYNRLLEILLDPDYDYFHQWAEQGSASEGRICLEFLIKELQNEKDNSNILAGLVTQLIRLNNRIGDKNESERWIQFLENNCSDGSLSDTLLHSVILHEQASQALYNGKLKEAFDAYKLALHSARIHVPPSLREISANLVGLANVTYLDTGRVDRTITFAALAYRYAIQADDPVHSAEACRILGDVYKDELNHELAEEQFMKGLKIAEDSELSNAQLSLLTAVGWCRYQKTILNEKNAEEAKTAFNNLLKKAMEFVDIRFQGDAWSGLGQCAILDDDSSSLQLAIDNLRSMEQKDLPPHLLARLYLLIAAREYKAKNYKSALEEYKKVFEQASAGRLWSRQVDALLGQGAVMLHTGRIEEGHACWDRATTLFSKCPKIRAIFAKRYFIRCKVDSRYCPV